MSAEPTQRDRILDRLREGPATSAEFVTEMGILRYGARIHELRERGYVITWKPVRKGSRTNRYELVTA